MREFRGRYGDINRRIERREPIEPTPIKYAPWWAPWRGWILMIAWLFFAKRHSDYRDAILWGGALFLFATAVLLFREQPDTWEFWRCVVLRQECVK